MESAVKHFAKIIRLSQKVVRPHARREDSDFINVLKRQWMQLPCYCYYYWNACPKGGWPGKPDAISTPKCRKFRLQSQCRSVPRHYTQNLRAFSTALLPWFPLPGSAVVAGVLRSKPNFAIIEACMWSEREKWEEKKWNLMIAINSVWCLIKRGKWGGKRGTLALRTFEINFWTSHEKFSFMFSSRN